MSAVILIAAMAVTTMALRFLPFLIFGKKTPGYISYLGEVLPQAIIALLVVYCLKDVSILTTPYGIPELLAGISVVVMQIWKEMPFLAFCWEQLST